MYASIGECSIAAVNLTSSQAILGIRPKDCLNYEFLYFYLTSLKKNKTARPARYTVQPKRE
jgi:type I restriction enzyme S subunit